MWVDYRVCTRRIDRLIDTLEYSVRDERRILVRYRRRGGWDLDAVLARKELAGSVFMTKPKAVVLQLIRAASAR